MLKQFYFASFQLQDLLYFQSNNKFIIKARQRIHLNNQNYRAFVTNKRQISRMILVPQQPQNQLTYLKQKYTDKLTKDNSKSNNICKHSKIRHKCSQQNDNKKTRKSLAKPLDKCQYYSLVPQNFDQNKYRYHKTDRSDNQKTLKIINNPSYYRHAQKANNRISIQNINTIQNLQSKITLFQAQISLQQKKSQLLLHQVDYLLQRQFQRQHKKLKKLIKSRSHKQFTSHINNIKKPQNDTSKKQASKQIQKSKIKYDHKQYFNQDRYSNLNNDNLQQTSTNKFHYRSQDKSKSRMKQLIYFHDHKKHGTTHNQIHQKSSIHHQNSQKQLPHHKKRSPNINDNGKRIQSSAKSFQSKSQLGQANTKQRLYNDQQISMNKKSKFNNVRKQNKKRQQQHRPPLKKDRQQLKDKTYADKNCDKDNQRQKQLKKNKDDKKVIRKQSESYLLEQQKQKSDTDKTHQINNYKVNHRQQQQNQQSQSAQPQNDQQYITNQFQGQQQSPKSKINKQNQFNRQNQYSQSKQEVSIQQHLIGYQQKTKKQVMMAGHIRKNSKSRINQNRLSKINQKSNIHSNQHQYHSLNYYPSQQEQVKYQIIESNFNTPYSKNGNNNSIKQNNNYYVLNNSNTKIKQSSCQLQLMKEFDRLVIEAAKQKQPIKKKLIRQQIFLTSTKIKQIIQNKSHHTQKKFKTYQN